MSNAKLYAMEFSKLYNNYVQKAEKKARTKEEVDEIIIWLLGYDLIHFQKQLDDKKTFEEFYNEAPRVNENISLIRGKVCGVVVEEVEDKLMRRSYCLDKLIDELSKGKPMEQILRD